MPSNAITRRTLLLNTGLALGASMLPPVSWANRKYDVIVIGAGLSGLYAASLLEQAGLSVKVLEGNSRIGGRLYTMDDVPGKPEAGGQTIGPTYGRTLFLALIHGIKLGNVDFSLGDEAIRQIMDIGGERVLPSEWAASPHNPFPAAFKNVPPDRLLMTSMGLPPFSDNKTWHSEALFSLDYSTANFLRAKGFDQSSIDMMGISNNYGRSLDESSLLFLHRNNAIVYDSMKTPGGMRSVIGGNQRLPETMAAALKTDVETGRKVTKINQQNKSVTVTCEDGSEHTASYVISSMPNTLLRDVEIKPGLAKLQAEAISELAYGQVFQAHFAVDTPFWEGKGFLPNVWTDSLIERVFASDPGNTGTITNLTAWINGKAVDQVEHLTYKDAQAMIEKDFYRILPEAKGNVRLAKLHSWTKEEFAKGSFAVWSPGQISRFSNTIATPSGRLHFAGEHTAEWGSGMEGALESGERAANEIISRTLA